MEPDDRRAPYKCAYAPCTLPTGLDPGLVIVGHVRGVDRRSPPCCCGMPGFAVQGLFMSNWDDAMRTAPQLRDFQDARRVLRVLGLPLHRVSFASSNGKRVLPILRNTRPGRTHEPRTSCATQRSSSALSGLHAPLGAVDRHWTPCEMDSAGATQAAPQGLRTRPGPELLLHQVAPPP